MGDRSGNPPQQLNQLSLIQNTVVTPEMYWQYQQQIQQAKQAIAQYEGELQAGYERYVTQEQQLRQQIEAGRQAERMLAQLRTSGSAAAPAQSLPSSSNLQTFPPTNGQPSSQSYRPSHVQQQAYQNLAAAPLRMPYGQAHAEQPHYQMAENSSNWPVYDTMATQSQVPHIASTPTRTLQPQPAGQLRRPVHASQPANGDHGNAYYRPQTGGSSGPSRPEVSYTGTSVSAVTAVQAAQDRGDNDQVRHAKKTYSSQHQGNLTPVVDAYNNCVNILKDLRPSMVDYIIFSALYQLRSKLPSGALNGQEVFQKVKSKLPQEGVTQLEKISAYVVQQLQALNANAIKLIVVRLKNMVMSQMQLQSQQAAVDGSALAGSSSQAVSAQSNVIPASPLDASIVTPNPLEDPAHPSHVQSVLVEPHSVSSSATEVNGSQDAAAGLAHQVFAQQEVIQEEAPSKLLAPSTPKFMPNASPTRRTVLPVRHCRPEVTPPPSELPHTLPLSSGDIANPVAPTERPAGTWTPAKADKARLARDIMRSLGRPVGTSPEHLPASQPQESLASELTTIKRKRAESVLTSPKKRKVEIVEVEEIATDGAMELAVWQRTAQVNGAPSVSGSVGSPDKRTNVIDVPPSGRELGTGSNAADLPQPPLSMEEGVGLATVGVNDFTVVDTTRHTSDAVTTSFATSAEFRSENDYLAIHLSQASNAEQPDGQSTDAQAEVLALPHVQSLRSAASGPPTSRTATPTPVVAPPTQDAEHPGTPAAAMSHAEADPLYLTTPLFLPSPTSSHSNDGGADNAEGNGGALMDRFILGDGLLDAASPPRIPSYLKGKGKVVYSDPEEDEPQSRKHIQPVNSDVEPVKLSSESKNYARKHTRDGTDAVVPENQNGHNNSKRDSSQLGAVQSQVYVLVPALPNWARRAKATAARAQSQVRARRDRRERKQSTPNTVPESEDELVMDDDMSEARRMEEEAQQQAVRLSYTRMHESPCQWQGCDVLMNTTEKLIQHVHAHASENRESKAYACHWWDCNRAFSSRTALANHLTRHASGSLLCAFEGCEKTFVTSKELLQHHKLGRHREQRLKPTAGPFAPDLLVSILPLPGVLPSYMRVPLRIARHPISKFIHNWLGTRVLENISSFSFTGRRMHHNAPSRSSRRLADKIAIVEQEGKTPSAKLGLLRQLAHDEYNNIARGRQLNASMRCNDIPSSDVSRMCQDGLVLFPPPGMERDDSVEVKSEVDELDFLHGAEPWNGEEDDRSGDVNASDQAMHDDRQPEASGSGHLLSDPAHVSADGATAASDDGEQSHHNTPMAGLRDLTSQPVWEVLPVGTTDEDVVNALL